MENGEDTGKMARMKELEAMVEKLTQEKKQLLTQFKGESAPTDCRTDEMNDDDILHISDTEIGEEDIWLYVSPIKPPTDEEKMVTPSQWLSEGQAKRRGQFQSFEEVRKSLMYTMDEAEQLTTKPPNAEVSENRLSHKKGPRFSPRDQSPTFDNSTHLIRKSRPINPSRTTPTGLLAGGRRQPNSDQSLRVKPVVKTPPNSDTSLRVKWDPSKATVATDSDEDTATPIKGEETMASLKVNWDPSKAAALVSTDSEEDLSRNPIDDDINSLRVNWSPASRSTNSEGDEQELKVVGKKWKVKQVPDNITNQQNIVNNEDEDETSNPTLQRKNTFTKEEMKTAAQRWNVRQVSDSNRADVVSGDSDETVQHRGTFSKEVGKKWKVKQVPDNITNERENENIADETRQRRNSYTKDSTEEDFTKKWKVKQVPSDDTTADKNDDLQNESAEDEDTPKSGSGLKRKGTFTKDKPKPEKYMNNKPEDRESPYSDRTADSPVTIDQPVAIDQPLLRTKWTPRSTSPSSSEDDRLYGYSPISPRDSPSSVRQSRYSTHQQSQQASTQMPRPLLTTPPSQVSGRGRGQLRIPSPGRRLTSPLQQQQKRASMEGVAAYQQESMAAATTTSKISPPKQKLQPPSPRRSSQLPQGGGNTKMTPPSRSTGQSNSSPVASKSTGITKKQGTGVKTVKKSPNQSAGMVTTATTVPSSKRRMLPVPQSIRGGASPRGRGTHRSTVTKQPVQEDNSWLDDCY